LKYAVDPNEFFGAISSAWENGTAVCGELLIRCRSKRADGSVFLMTKGSKVVSQFPIAKEFFLEPGNPIKSSGGASLLRRRIIRKSGKPYSSYIRDLRAGMKKISLKATVSAIPEPSLVFTRFGNYASVANATVVDETGTIKLCLWNEQINTVSVGDTIQIENAHMSLFRGQPQLRIGKTGKLSVLERIGIAR
jgi:replication factor A1